VNPEDRTLVVLLLRMQWLLDDAAHDIPAGRFHCSKQHELADLLDEASRMMRERAHRSLVIEGEIGHP
jgi:hypothetical protein